MPYTKEYATTTNEVYERNYGNSEARFFCNNPIRTTNDLNQAIKTYKTIYDIYTTNNGNNSMPSGKIDTNNCINGCPNDIVSSRTLASRNNVFYASGKSIRDGALYVSDLDVYLDDCGAQIRNYDINNNPKSYTNDLNYAHNFIDVSYNNLLVTRNDLDNKMNEILGNNHNSILYEKQNELDSSVYSTLLWTVMITSLIYYTFTKI